MLSMQPNEYLPDASTVATDVSLVYPAADTFIFSEGNQVLDYGDMKTFFGALLSDWNGIS